ncbi:MAG TPA: hypothetical protein VK611_27230 [Acidimicrobiales bacterium]|nr:hypothetical protein [Acidimicrobiales bacterium]
MVPGDTTPHLLFLREDVVLDPGGLDALMAVAEATGAAIVGPKLVSAEDPQRLVDVGYGVTKAGEVVSLVEPDELDQGQHDGTRDVFALPSACLLVRADVFRSIGGCDPALPYGTPEADVSLCWRARTAGAGVVVTSDARALVPSDARPPAGDPRHRLRLVLSCYGRAHRLRVVPQVVGAGVVGSLRDLLTARPRQVGAAMGAWAWNLWRWRSLRAVRRPVRTARRTPDRTVRRLQVPGVLRPRLAARRGMGGGAALGVPRPVAAWADGLRQRWTSEGAVVMLALVGVLALGSRHLLSRGVPTVGDLLPVGVDGLHTGAGALRVLLTVGLVPAGIAGVLAAVRPLGSPRAPVAAAVAYAALPMPYAALAEGRWAPLAVYAVVPWWLVQLGLVGPPTVSGARRAAVLGILAALAATVVPAAPLLLAGLGVALAVGSLLAFRFRDVLPTAAVAVAGGLVGVVLHLPWAIAPSSPGSPWQALRALVDGTGATGVPVDVEPVDLLGFGAGHPAVLPWLWALPLAAVIPLLAGRGTRLVGGIRAWTLALVAWAVALAAGRAGVAAPLPDVDVLLVVAGVGVAAAVGLAAAAVEADLASPRRRRVRRRDRRRWHAPTQARRLGWRSLTGAVGLVAVALATIPLLKASLDGYWGMPRGDFGSVLAFVDDDVAATGGRILWLGDTAVLPLQMGRAGGTAALAVTDRLPRMPDRWRPAPTALLAGTREAVESSTSYATSRVGRALARLGVEYVVVPQGLAPSPFQVPGAPSPRVVDALDGQFDLERVDVDPAVVVYRNLEFRSRPRPVAAAPPDPSSSAPPEAPAVPGEPSEPSPWKVRLGLTAWGAVLLFLVVHQRRTADMQAQEQ